MTKKQLIINSAIQLFAEKGIEATSVQQITDQCGISKGAFYLSFKSKDELILAIIEHFMNNIILHVDQAVTEASDASEKLYIYFVQTFTILSEYTGFAEIFMREKISSINDALIEKIQYYVALSNENLEKLLFDVFGEEINGKQYDLIVIINGMIQSYSQLFCELQQPYNISKLAKSLVEKTTLLATQSQVNFLEKSHIPPQQMKDYPLKKLADELSNLFEYANDPLEKESLDLLIEELKMEQPRTAIVIGLLTNLSKNDKFHWYGFLIKKQVTA